MYKTFSLLSFFFCVSVASVALAQEKISDVFADPTIDFSRPADRARAMKRIEVIENARLQDARAKGKAMGLPLRREKPGGGVQELIDFEGEKPVYLETKNANAAISTAANLVRTSPYMLDGSGLTVGVWDAAGGRPTHQEFATDSRLTNMNGTAMNYHSMHVAGTIAALGVDALSRGMANNARINSYDWNSDISEMGTAGATAAGQTATKLYLSNHSYGTADGWDGNTWTGTGTDQNAYDSDFGQYSSGASSMDSTAYNTPYFLSFWAAGNDRSNNPSTNSQVVIGGVTVSYNPAIHPQGDGIYRGGYETISYRSTAKNILTIGAVNDAVTSSVRDLAKATIASLSSTGPTDDGRIKPDLVANGVGLKSTYETSDTAYGTISGTSMATPNACGSATLLVDQYNRLFGSAMRSSTLKALLIHTADDIGNPGPDYFFGWGLMNVKKAADIIANHSANPALQQIAEGRLTTTTTSQTYAFNWDGISPLRATVAWTDPAGTAISSHDSRTARLVNNLNLKLIAPNGTEYSPYVMPFVGTWTVASMSQNATTGINNTDNVEQVYVANPAQSGSWQAVVSYTGGLTNSQQDYGLVLSGLQQQADEQAPTPNPMSWASAPAPGADPQTQITMTATTATDLSGVEYFFDETSGTLGGTDSGWQDSPTYTDSGLFPGTQYSYSVTARDKSVNQNTTTASAPTSATTSGTPDTTPPNPSPMTFSSFPVASGQTSIVMTATTATDLNGVEYFFDETSGNSGGTDSGWQNSPTYEDTGLLAGTAYTYTVTARDKSPNANAGTASSVATAYTQAVSGGTDFANADLAVSGTVTGTYSNTLSSNNSYEQLTETETNGRLADRYSYLEHKWSFNVTGGTTVTFNIEAYHTLNSEGDDFVFAYSTTGANGTYTDMLTVTKTADDNAIQSYSLPPGTSGTVHVRVLDTDQTSGRKTLDSLYIDSMYFVSGSSGGDSNPPTLVSIVDNQGGGPIEFNTPVTYTVTFSKDMDAATVTADDFANTGTSTVTISTITEISPSVFTVLVTPTTTGSLQLRINAGADLRDANNIAMITTSALADDVTITVTGITLSNLNQTYNGSPKPVTVTTNPVGLAHTVTYNESATAPTNAGTYPVVATITDPNYSGSTSGSLVIAKASQTIDFAALTPVPDDQPTLELTATAASGLPVSYTSSNLAVSTVTGTTVTIVGLGTTTITASQAGDANYNAATSVPQTLTVVRANPLAVTSGPYSVLISQSVSLNGTASQSSYNKTISSYEWDLNNDNTFGDVTGANVDISYTTLNTTWGRVPGPNTIQLKVTDSSGKTSITSTTLTLIATLTWDSNTASGGAQDGAGAWLTTNQWWTGSANATWSSGANAIFGNGSAGGAVTLASATTVNSLILNSFTSAYTLGTVGNKITLNGGITKNAGSGTASIISPVTLGGSQGWINNSFGLLTVSGALDTGAAASPDNFTLTFDGTGTTTASSVISGTGAIVKNGPGRVSFGTGSVANTYTGPTTVNGGILSIANSSTSLGGGNLTLNGGVLGFYWSSGLTRTLGIGDSQVQILGGESGFGGDGSTGPTISLGTTAVWGASGVGTATGFFNPSKFVLGSFDTTNTGLTTFSSAINLNGVTRTIVVPMGLSSGGNVSKISGVISSSGTAGLIKEGGGTLILDAANTYLGDTTISGGTLRIGNNTSGSLNGGDYSGNISIASDATLQIWSTTAHTLSGVISGEGGLDKAYGGALTLSGPNTYNGLTSISAGKLFINGTLSNTAAALNVGTGATLGGTGTIGRDVTVDAGGKLEFDISTVAASHSRLNISSGRNFGFAGASELTITSSAGASPGTYTLITGGNNITGVAPAAVNLPANWTATVSISGNSLLLNVVSTDASGPVDHFVISSIGSPQTVGTPVTGITITAEDSSNATATGFTGTVTFGGTGGFSGTSAIFSEGVLSSVSVTPTVAGSDLTFTVDDGASHTGTATITTIQTQYAAWSGASAFDADDNGDGVENGLAWVLGAADANANAIGLLPTLSTGGGNMLFTFKRSQESINPNTTVSIEVGTTLGSWPDVYTVEATSAGDVTVEKDTPATGTDTVTLSVPQSTDPMKFSRLKVIQAP
jgi:autotransporter-associated beta strand protein